MRRDSGKECQLALTLPARYVRRGVLVATAIESSRPWRRWPGRRVPPAVSTNPHDVGSAGFSIRYSKVSFPTDGKLEQQLASDQRVDVYGIHFDVNSDRIRTESDPVLREVADVLQRNGQWQVTIDGHSCRRAGMARRCRRIRTTRPKGARAIVASSWCAASYS